MPRPSRAERRRERAHRDLASKGWTCIVLGVLMLFVFPALFRSGSPIAAQLEQAFRPAGWLALLAGAALLALHYFVRRHTDASSANKPFRVTPVPKVGRPMATPVPSQPQPQSQSQSQSQPGEPREPMLAPDPLSQRPARSSDATPRPSSEWSPAVFAAIEWRRFEALCEAFYAQAGLGTRSQSHGADGGVDIWLQSRHMEAPRIVQCKHWLGKPVGVKEMREFLGVMASHQLRHGTYVTSSTFTADALAFATANGIQTQDGTALLKLIPQRTPEQQAALLAVAHEGEYWKPTCASCGIKTTPRERKRDGSAFWGCSNYPRCKTTFVMRTV
jgi:restriction system protein